LVLSEPDLLTPTQKRGAGRGGILAAANLFQKQAPRILLNLNLAGFVLVATREHPIVGNPGIWLATMGFRISRFSKLRQRRRFRTLLRSYSLRRFVLVS
jgi:hypothetical protein